MTAIDLEADNATIDRNKGPAALAEKLGYSRERVQNWKTRGIPFFERVKHKCLRRKGERF